MPRSIPLTLALFAFAATCAAQIRPANPPSGREPDPVSPPPATPAAPAAPQPPKGDRTARAMIEGAAARQGGAKRLEEIKSFESDLEVTVFGEDASTEITVMQTWMRPDRLRTRVSEDGRAPIETSFDSTNVHVRNGSQPWESFTPEESPKDYRDIRDNLRRIDSLINLFAPAAEFVDRGTKLVRIQHVGSYPFAFVDPADPKARERDLYLNDERLSILEVRVIARRDTKGSEELMLYLDETAGSPTAGFIVGVSRLEKSKSGTPEWETLWFRTFLALEDPRYKDVLVPRMIQIYRTIDLYGRGDAASIVEIHRLVPNLPLAERDFKPVAR